MSSAHENSWSWIDYLAKTVDKLTHGVTNLVSTTVGLTCNLTDFVIGDETQQKFSDFSNECIAWLTFDDFQLQLLKIFLFTFVSTVALIFIAWHIYGARISEHFMEQSKRIHDFCFHLCIFSPRAARQSVMHLLRLYPR